MSTIQNLKNFIRHGKQARLVTPHAEPTTDVTTVHAQQQRQPQGQYANNLDTIEHKHGNGQTPAQSQSQSQSPQQQQQQKAADAQNKVSRADIEKLVAEERQSKSKMPKYPGLDRYILIEKMGDGAFSNVYRAKDTLNGMEEVAIKVVRKFEMNNNQGDINLRPYKKKPKAVERANILKEVQIMRQLDHPNIVRLIDFSESPQFYYIVLELCPGGELFHQIVRLTYFSEDLSRHVIKQVAEAIEFLHETSGVVHRDIKPENLLFYPCEYRPTKNPKPRQPGDEDKVDEGEFIPGVGAGGIGKIKIADFGLSKVIWDSQTMTPCGTVGYTAPEIVKDERYSKSVDMWALGCVLYTLLCGFPPFYDESIQVLTEKVARGQYTFLSPWWDDISKSAQDLVSHLLTVDPDKRYTIGQFLNHPWIKQTDETTHAAADAPPLATPQISRQKETAQQQQQTIDIGQTPLSATERRLQDFRSPGAVNLREVFDVGYAVHRQEEEGKRRKNFRQGYRGANPRTGFSAQLNPLNEDYDDEEEEAYGTNNNNNVGDQREPPAKIPRSSQGGANDVAAMEAKLRSTNLGTQPSSAAQARQSARSGGAGETRGRQRHQHQHQQQQGYGQHSAAVAAAARQNAARTAKQPFELNMANATLLERRGRRAPGQAV